MEERRFRILSIDFDFFQWPERDVLRYYPDGIDVSTKLSTIVWAGYYTEAAKESGIQDVRFDQENFDELLKLLKKQRYATPAMICNSHRYIYDFVHECVPRLDTPISIVNVDMHHDMFNDCEEVDCGNWVGHLKNEYQDMKLYWITKPVSLEAYGITEMAEKEFKDKVLYDLSTIMDTRFDMVFLCRSDPWLPPHLDKYFTVLANRLCSQFRSVYGDPRVLEPRNYMDIVKEYEKVSDSVKQLNKLVREGKI